MRVGPSRRRDTERDVRAEVCYYGMGERVAMPTKPLRVCAAPGCGELVPRGHCPAHQIKQSDRRKHDPEQRRFYNSHRWQKIRAAIRSRYPVCQVCHDALSEQVHHKDGDWRNNDPANLEGICKDCHASESGRQHREKQGGVNTERGSDIDGAPLDPAHHWRDR